MPNANTRVGVIAWHLMAANCSVGTARNLATNVLRSFRRTPSDTFEVTSVVFSSRSADVKSASAYLSTTLTAIRVGGAASSSAAAAPIARDASSPASAATTRSHVRSHSPGGNSLCTMKMYACGVMRRSARATSMSRLVSSTRAPCRSASGDGMSAGASTRRPLVSMAAHRPSALRVYISKWSCTAAQPSSQVGAATVKRSVRSANSLSQGETVQSAGASCASRSGGSRLPLKPSKSRPRAG